MRHLLLLAAFVSAAAMAAGCFETKQDMTLNPDGSGKTRVEVIMSDMPFQMPPDQEPPPPELVAKQFAKSVLDESKGVDTWSDVEVGRTEDSRSRFTGTAYFKDFTKVQIQGTKMEGVTLAPDGKGGVILKMEPPKGDKEKKPDAQPPQMTEEQIQQAIQAERMKWQQLKPMMTMMLGKMKMELIFHLPGPLTQVKGFAKTADGGVRFAMEGAKVLAALDKFMADDAYVRQQVLTGGGDPGQPPMDDPAVIKEMFGIEGALEAHAGPPVKAQFDYQAEVQAAKAAYPAMIKKLGLDRLPQESGPMMPPGFDFGGPGGAGMP